MSLGSLKFDESFDQYLLVSPSNSLVLTGDCTIEFFFKWSVKDGNNGILIAAGPSGPIMISVNRAAENNTRIYFNTSSASTYNPTKSINDNEWHHVAFVRKGISSNNVSVFVDGAIDGYVTNSSTWNFGSGFMIGGWMLYDGTPYHPNSYNGYLSNLRICKNAVYNGPFQVQFKNLTIIPRTVLLLNMASDNPYMDSSINNIAITAYNNPTQMQISPFEFLNKFLILSTDKKTVTSYDANIDVAGTTITIPSSVTSIASSAFSGCAALTSITLQRTSDQVLTTLGSNCFLGTGLTVASVLTLYNQGYTRDNLVTSGIPRNVVDQTIASQDGVVNVTAYYYFTI